MSAVMMTGNVFSCEQDVAFTRWPMLNLPVGMSGA
jgi:hypothetical protein